MSDPRAHPEAADAADAETGAVTGAETGAAAGDALGPEDAKLVALARAGRTRTGAAEGAAVRDDTGRSYAATTVDLPSLRLTALQAAVAAAVSSGARALEAAAVVTADPTAAREDASVVRDLGGPAVPVHVVGLVP